MTEDDAVRQCQGGDRDAFHYLVERYKDILYGSAYLMTNNRALAEEQVQEAFLSAWQGIRGFQLGRPFKPWLVRILVNGVLAQRRRRSVATAPLEESVTGADAVGLEDTVEALEDRHKVRCALACLIQEHRQVLVLRYFADLTVPQVAQSLKVREGTVKSRLHRALGHLRTQLESMGAAGSFNCHRRSV